MSKKASNPEPPLKPGERPTPPGGPPLADNKDEDTKAMVEQVAGELGSVEQPDELMNLIALDDQVIMLGADWSNTRGHTGRFQFRPSDKGGHPLEPFSNGARFQMVLVQIDDDEAPIDQKLKKKLDKQLKEANKGGRWSNDCAMLCKMKVFHRYLLNMNKMMPSWDVETRETVARAYVLDTLKIKSRREIDHGDETIAAYNNLILEPFREFKRNLPESKP